MRCSPRLCSWSSTFYPLHYTPLSSLISLYRIVIISLRMTLRSQSHFLWFTHEQRITDGNLYVTASTEIHSSANRLKARTMLSTDTPTAYSYQCRPQGLRGRHSSAAYYQWRKYAAPPHTGLLCTVWLFPRQPQHPTKGTPSIALWSRSDLIRDSTFVTQWYLPTKASCAKTQGRKDRHIAIT